MHRRRSPFAVPVAMVLSVAIMLIGVPVAAIADEAVPATQAPTVSSTDAATATTEPSSDPAESTPVSSADPTTADPEGGVTDSELHDATVSPSDATPLEAVAGDDAADVGEDSSDGGAPDDVNDAAKAAPAVIAAAAPTGQTTIRVTTGGDRQIDGSISPLAGVRFIAIDADYDDALANSPDLADRPAAAECVTDATGTCQMTVDDRASGPNDGYWVLEAPTASDPLPGGYSALDSYGLGDFTAAKTVTQHRYHTGPISGADAIRNVPAGPGVRPPFGVNTSGGNGTSWANAYDNAAYPTLCGAQIAIVVDRSASISGTEMGSFRTAVQSFVGADGLGPTPSTADVYTFSTTASKVTASPVVIWLRRPRRGSERGHGGSWRWLHQLGCRAPARARSAGPVRPRDLPHGR